MSYHSSAQGFTLVELAIALMVIGLLIGGVLKGQELIENARVTATVRQLKAYDTAVMVFRNTYNAIPGDIKKVSRIPNCTTAVCNIAGDGNGRVETWGEQFNFFTHLTKAGLIQGPEGGDSDQRDNADGGSSTVEYDLFYPRLPIETGVNYYFITYNDTSYMSTYTISLTPQAGHYHQIDSWPAKAAAAIDAKIDDGFTNKGDMVVSTTTNCAATTPSDGSEYDIVNGTACHTYIRAEF